MAEHDVARKEVTSARSTRSSCRASRGEPWASSLVTSCWWSLWRIRSSCSANPPAMSRRRGVSCEASTRRTIFAGNGEPGSEAATGMAACPTPSRSRFLKCSRRPDEGRRTALAALLVSFPGIALDRRWPRDGRPRRVHPGALSPAYARCDSPRHGNPRRCGRFSDERPRPAPGQGGTCSTHRRASLGRYPLSAQPCMLSLTYALEA
jgi:hypothetical protein